MKPTKTESITVIMPCDKITQLKARAAKLGCTPDELAVRALARAKAGFYEKNKKDTAFLVRAESKAKEICDALNRDKDYSFTTAAFGLDPFRLAL